MTQYAYPKSDITIGNWTTAPLWSKVEEEPYSDADYVQSAKNEANDYFEVELDDIDDPITHDDHILRVRIKETKDSGFAYQIQLYQGAVQIATTTSEQVAGTSFIEKTLSHLKSVNFFISFNLNIFAFLLIQNNQSHCYLLH